jgi:hypothetical protein
METRGKLRSSLAGAVAVAVAAGLSPVASAQPPPCPSWEVEYALSANLRLSDTPLGQGDGVYSIGPGRVVLRFEQRDGQPSGRVAMLSFDMREHFTVRSKTLVWTTTVVTEADARATPDACGVAAQGMLAGATLAWTTPVRGYRTDGTLTCSGSLCGAFGAPPPGRSELHIGPGPVELQSFAFAGDMNTFTMPYAQVSKTDSPAQTAQLALGAREVRRTCVPTTSCSP